MCKDWLSIIKMIVNFITRLVMKLEHPEDLSFFYECRTFLHKKILSGYVRVLDLSSFLPPLLNNVGLKKDIHISTCYGGIKKDVHISAR